MPTERFYRLPEEKKRSICSAAVKEFARVPLDKVSINQIIKEADISRGSFYTYFEDKWDLLACIFEDSQNRLRDFCREALITSGGNIWVMPVSYTHLDVYKRQALMPGLVVFSGTSGVFFI